MTSVIVVFEYMLTGARLKEVGRFEDFDAANAYILNQADLGPMRQFVMLKLFMVNGIAAAGAMLPGDLLE